ncbi:rhomboid family intramembrane serine protease [Dactylosporangium sp. McL0621]|uniref:rhomboid family intramembrane serine protease n=1 Tax=Dactylosporangium sp. McL0621 TaxID=3415678 RepID=UPI003CEE2768
MAVLYVALLVTAGLAGAPVSRKFPIATAVAFGLVAVFSLLQLTVAPALYEALRRDRAAIAGGELWRLVTSFVVQDSGWPGTIFNLVTLAVIGTLAERRWGTVRWIGLALVVQVLGDLWGLVVYPVGAGTSLVNFGLAASLAAAALLGEPDRRRRLAAAVSLVVALVLLVLGDIHGGAAVLGALGGAALARLEVSRPGPRSGAPGRFRRVPRWPSGR